MLTVKQLAEWLTDLPEDAEVIGEYYEKSNVIDLKVVRPDGCICTIGIE